MPEPTGDHERTWARSRRRGPRLRHALALIIALLVGSVGAGTTASGAPICTYDVPTLSCVGVPANEVAEAGVSHTADSRERPAMPAADARGASTTSSGSVVATNTVDDAVSAVPGGPKPTPNFKPPTNPAQVPPTEIPAGWRVREMPPTPQYPDGYWKLEKPMPNGGWQPIDPSTMKPGGRPETHIPFPPGG